jgi:hypothetical protein
VPQEQCVHVNRSNMKREALLADQYTLVQILHGKLRQCSLSCLQKASRGSRSQANAALSVKSSQHIQLTRLKSFLDYRFS